MERAAASGARLDLNDADAAIVASICRKLDGVALAIELAAGRVEAYGLQETAALLEQRLTLLWLGSARRRHVSGPCRPRWTGVTGSCLSWNAWCFADSPCSSAISRSRRRGPS